MGIHIEDNKIYGAGLGIFFLFVGYVIFNETTINNSIHEKPPRLNVQYTNTNNISDRNYNTNQMRLEDSLIK